MKTIDLHCDTVFELYENGQFDLNQNERCVDLAKLQKCGSLIQCFALYDRKKRKIHYDYERLKQIIAFFDALIENHRSESGVFLMPASKLDATEHPARRLEDCGAVQSRHRTHRRRLYAAGGAVGRAHMEHENCFARRMRLIRSHTALRRSALKRSAISKRLGSLSMSPTCRTKLFGTYSARRAKAFYRIHSNARAILCVIPATLRETTCCGQLAMRAAFCGLNFLSHICYGQLCVHRRAGSAACRAHQKNRRMRNDRDRQ
jgi:microsomal dipeptidase-like Zn-dependent dipeptidase